MLLVVPKLFHGVDHGEDVLSGDVVHHGVDGTEHVAAAFAQDADDALDLVADLLRGAEGQDLQGVDGAAEDDVLAKLGLERLQVRHLARRGLDRVEDIHAHLDEVWDERQDVTVGVEHDFGPGVLFNEGNIVRVDGLEDGAVHLGRHEQAGVHAQVVADLDDVDVVAALAQEMSHEGLAQRGVLLQQGPGKIGALGHVHQELVHALHLEGAFEREEQPGRGDDSVLVLVCQLLGTGLDVRHAGRVVHVRPGVGFKFLKGGGILQRMDAREPRARFALDGAAAPRVEVRRVRLPLAIPLHHGGRLQVEDAAHIAMQTFEGGLVHVGGAQLGPVINVTILGLHADQFLDAAVGAHLDARGIAGAEYDRHAVGDFVIQHGKDTFTGGHGHIVVKLL